MEEKSMNDFETPHEYCAENGITPKCPICGEELEIRQTQYVDLYWNWKWNPKEKTFHKDEGDGDSDKPHCASCGESLGWDAVDGVDFGEEAYASY